MQDISLLLVDQGAKPPELGPGGPCWILGVHKQVTLKENTTLLSSNETQLLAVHRCGYVRAWMLLFEYFKERHLLISDFLQSGGKLAGTSASGSST